MQTIHHVTAQRAKTPQRAVAALTSLVSLATVAAVSGCAAQAPRQGVASPRFDPVPQPSYAQAESEQRYRALVTALPAEEPTDDVEEITVSSSGEGAGAGPGPAPARELANTRVEGRNFGGSVGATAGNVAAGQAAGAGGGATATAATGGEVATKLPEQLVVEGSLQLEVERVPDAAAAIRAEVEASGGRVVSEQLSGSAESWYGQMQVKLPPAKVPGFLGWLAQHGEITNKRIQGTDVSRTLFDQALALDNLELTMSRMRALLDRQGLEMKDILAIENELTRLRGEIERIKGEKRWLEHRVAFATLDVTLRRRAGVILGARAKLYPGPRASALVLLTPEGRERVRVGGGLAIHTPVPRLTLELDVFQAPEGESSAVLATMGGAAYSDFLGRGERSFLNPYLGGRLGYGYLDGSAFVFGAGGGLELFKHEYVLIDANVFVYGFAREQFDVGLVASGSAVFAF